MSFSAKLDLGSYSIFVAKTASKKIGALIRSMKFLYPEVYCCHDWAGARICYLEMLDKLRKRIYKTVGPSLAALLEHLVYH